MHMMTWEQAADRAAAMRAEDRPRVYNTVVKQNDDHVTAFVCDGMLYVPTEAADPYLRDTFLNYAHMVQVFEQVRDLCNTRRMNQARQDRMWQEMGAHVLMFQARG
jgi:hypothetical protein